MENSFLNRIEANPNVMYGKPVIKGTRLTVEIILEKLGHGITEQEIINEYPFLKSEDIKASLLYAAKSLSFEEILAVE